MKESTLTAHIMWYARRFGCFAVKWHMSMYGSGGMPDIYILVPAKPHAIPLHIEVKVPGNVPTQRQSKVLRDLQKGGAVAFWTDSLNEVVQLITILQEGPGYVVKYEKDSRLCWEH